MREHGPSRKTGPIRGLRVLRPGNTDVAEPVNNPKNERRTTRRTNLEVFKDTSSGGNDPMIRTHLVERIRREIAAGTYDSDEKLEAALDTLLARLDS
jgi:anti-sigma28 factor (negative regulator of flagellin synthesis)